MELELSESIILNKFLLEEDECDKFIQIYNSEIKYDLDHLGGLRRYCQIIMPDEIINKITNLLSAYIVVKKIDSIGKIHHTVQGGIKEHTDYPFYDEELKSNSKYTLVIYLSSTEDNSGKTKIKRLKTRVFEDEISDYKHERVAITPTKGYSVIFNHNLLHYAEDSCGDKYILVLRVY
jgi:hypothetical protein